MVFRDRARLAHVWFSIPFVLAGCYTTGDLATDGAVSTDAGRDGHATADATADDAPHIDDAHRPADAVTSEDATPTHDATAADVRVVLDGSAFDAPLRDAMSVSDAPSGCGNGRTSGREQCDDGNNISGDGCSGFCTFEGSSCDQVVDFDFASTPNADGTRMMTVEARGRPIVGVVPPDCSRDDAAGGIIVRYAAAVAESVTVDTLGSVHSDGSTADTILVARSTCGGEALACSSSSTSPGPTSSLELDLAAGQVVFFELSGSRFISSDPEPLIVTLRVRSRAAVGVGEACDLAGATSRCSAGLVCAPRDSRCAAPACGDGVLSSPEDCDDGNTTAGDGCSATCTASDSCATPIDLATAGVVVDGERRFPFTLRGMSRARGSCGGNGPEHILSFTAPAAGTLRLDLRANEGDPVLYVRRSCADPMEAGNELACSDDADGRNSFVTLSLEAGAIVFVFADSFGASSDAFELRSLFTPES